MTEQELINKLENATSTSEAAQILSESGIPTTQADIERSISNFADMELGEEDLDHVAGGILRDVIKYASSAGILFRAYYDTVRYGDAMRTYSKKQIYSAAATWGLEE